MREINKQETLSNNNVKPKGEFVEETKQLICNILNRLEEEYKLTMERMRQFIKEKKYENADFERRYAQGLDKARRVILEEIREFTEVERDG